MNRSLWYDPYVRRAIPVPDDLDEYPCPRCTGRRPVVRKMSDILCADCRLVLLNR